MWLLASEYQLLHRLKNSNTTKTKGNVAKADTTAFHFCLPLTVIPANVLLSFHAALRDRQSTCRFLAIMIDESFRFCMQFELSTTDVTRRLSLQNSPIAFKPNDPSTPQVSFCRITCISLAPTVFQLQSRVPACSCSRPWPGKPASNAVQFSFLRIFILLIVTFCRHSRFAGGQHLPARLAVTYYRIPCWRGGYQPHRLGLRVGICHRTDALGPCSDFMGRN